MLVLVWSAGGPEIGFAQAAAETERRDDPTRAPARGRDSDADSDGDTGRNTEAEADSDSEADTEADTETEAETEADTEVDTEADTGATADSETNSGTDAGSDLGTGSGAGADTDSGADSGAGADTDFDSESDNEASEPEPPVVVQAESDVLELSPEVHASRPLEARYLDALAGSLAGTLGVAGGVGALGMFVGLGGGCAVQGEAGCYAGALGGVLAGASIGWLIGPGVGSSAGAGLEPLEGLGVWALGLASNLVLLGLGSLVGLAVDAAPNTWGLGIVWTMIGGTALGALAQVFLTPLYAVLLFEEDRSSAGTSRSPALTLAPFVAPTRGGASGGLAGAF